MADDKSLQNDIALDLLFSVLSLELNIQYQSSAPDNYASGTMISFGWNSSHKLFLESIPYWLLMFGDILLTFW